MSVTILPDEILEHILSYLSVVVELEIASQVCQSWRKICKSITIIKNAIFEDRARKGSFVWRQCGIKPRQSLSHHFVPKHQRSRNSGVLELSRPSPRSLHKSCSYKDRIFLFGGQAQASYFNDMFEYNVLNHKWNKVVSTGPSPTPRSHFSFICFKDNLIMCGGIIQKSNSIRQFEKCYSDIYIFSITKSTWYIAGSMSHSRHSHGCVCISEGLGLKLIMIGGQSTAIHYSESVEICYLSLAEGQFQVVRSACFSIPIRFKWSCQVIVNDHNILVYGGMTNSLNPSELPQVECIINDAFMLQFNDDYSDVEYKSLIVNNLGFYNGQYPALVNDFVRIKDSVIFLQKSIFIKDSSTLPGYFVFDRDRKPSGDEIYRQDYYHTFILNFDDVLQTQSISWVPIERNPPNLSPRSSVFHQTTLVGDSIFVFGGAVTNQRSRQHESSDNLYKVNVLKESIL